MFKCYIHFAQKDLKMLLNDFSSHWADFFFNFVKKILLKKGTAHLANNPITKCTKDTDFSLKSINRWQKTTQKDVQHHY